MSDAQAVWDSFAAHLRAFYYIAKVQGQAAYDWLAPPARAAIGWIDGHVRAAIAAARPWVRSGIELAQPYAQTGYSFLVAYWLAAVTVAVAVIVLIALGVRMRRQRRVKATLVDVSLDRDPRTEWLKLDIVMRNFQPHSLLVRSLRVEQPRDAMICDYWKAWQPFAEGVRFIAGDLALTNEADIERTILPYGGNGYGRGAGGLPLRQAGEDDQLTRSFYVRAPAAAAAQPVKLCAVLHCELQARRVRRLKLAFERMLESPAAQ
jgi:hypothetical protein